MANYTGVKRTAIVEIESGKRCVKAEELRQFSRLFRMSADELLEEDEIPISNDELLRGFTELDATDQQEILNLIEFKKMLKNRKN